jgi:serine/threonine protein kinase
LPKALGTFECPQSWTTTRAASGSASSIWRGGRSSQRCSGAAAFLVSRTLQSTASYATPGAPWPEYHAGSGKIHGDFDPTNVLFSVDDPRICLIDFSRPDFADYPDYCRGSIYRDLALFVIHLCVKYPPHQLLLAYRSKNRVLARAFLEGYFELSTQRYSFDELRTEFAICMEIPYLAHSFMIRFLPWTDRFNLEHLR